MDEKLHRLHLMVLLISTVVYLVTAMHSLGYYYFDEQYQILEFANLKLGLSNAEDLAWEYSARIRPATQPAIYMVLYEIASLLDLKDPYSITFLSRVLSMVLLF